MASADVAAKPARRTNITVAFVGDPKRWAKLFAKLTEQAKATTAIVGCDPADVIDKFGWKFADLTGEDIVEAGRSGFRGRGALEAALKTRFPRIDVRDPAGRIAPRARESSPRSRGSRANGQRAPGRQAAGGDEPPPPAPCGRAGCKRKIVGRKSTAIYCSDSCRVIACRARKREQLAWPNGFDEAEEALVALIARRETTPLEALERIVTAWTLVAA